MTCQHKKSKAFEVFKHDKFSTLELFSTRIFKHKKLKKLIIKTNDFFPQRYIMIASMEYPHLALPHVTPG